MHCEKSVLIATISNEIAMLLNNILQQKKFSFCISIKDKFLFCLYFLQLLLSNLLIIFYARN